ncbi:hypothetical protein ElyMa_005386300 [Elysia marginata]|uniref:C-type lectin domain-containing protein n=1 Tax=Elysia marginata TaxID=1093978 RepID=A0AAV4EEG4_9GAST|nr:hypothetical protein ElyMa_005386300 [Elysia marginata]
MFVLLPVFAWFLGNAGLAEAVLKSLEIQVDWCPSGWIRSLSTRTCIKLFHNKVTWKKAREHCQLNGGDLVKIKDHETNILVGHQVQQYPEQVFSFGLVQVATEWHWLDEASPLLEEGKLNIPTSEFKVNTTRRTIPFMIVGDEAFPLKTYLLKPYAAKTLDQEKRIYNYRHSRARRTVECAFGILAKKFGIFQSPLRVEPDKAVLLTNAALVLHNFIRRRDGCMVDRTSDVTYEVVEGQGRGMFALEAPTHGGRSSAEAMAILDSVKTFFNDPQGGNVPWQHENVFRIVIANEID